MAGVNGQAVSSEQVKDLLLSSEPLTQGYRPTLPLWALYTADTVPQFYLLRDVELMMIHPVVLSALNFFKGGIAGVEFDIPSDSSEVSEFVGAQCQRWWDRGVPKIQGGYEYGWIGCENMFSDADGPLVWDDLIQFSPRDVYLLTRDARPIGIRVKQVKPTDRNETFPRADDSVGAGAIDLWMGTEDIPAKGLWYPHNPRYSQYYGQSQLLGAWRPWRRLAWKDGAETNIDGGFYRGYYSGPLVRYPEEDYQGPANSPATTLDSQGRSRKYARDFARQLAEWYKSGAGVGLPSSKYPTEMGGGDKWDMEFPQVRLNIDGGVNYVKHLWDQIRYGVGVPPELMEAAESGSGYSGRSIPLEGFIMQQQRLADAILSLFVRQVLKPLVLWNFGPVRWDAKVKPLLETKSRLKQAQAGQAAAGAPSEAPPGQTPVSGPQGQGIAAQVPPINGWGGFSLSDRILSITRKILAERAA